jgi:hypothetical protein
MLDTNAEPERASAFQEAIKPVKAGIRPLRAFRGIYILVLEVDWVLV